MKLRLDLLEHLLLSIGYTQPQADEIARRAASAEIAQRLAAQKVIVEERLRTIKIPTLLIDGRRFDRVIGEEKLLQIIREQQS